MDADGVVTADALMERYRQEPTDDLRERIVEANIKLAYMLINRYYALAYCSHLEPDDLLAPAYLSLRQAVEHYSPEKGKFGTYAYICVQRGILNYIRDHRFKGLRNRRDWDAKVHQPDVVSYDDTRAGDPVDWESVNNHLVLESALDALPHPRGYILREIFYNKRPIREICDDLGICHQRVSVLKLQALDTLRRSYDLIDAFAVDDLASAG